MKDKVISATILMIFCITLWGSFVRVSSAQPQMTGATPSLYKRVGGYDTIAAVADDFLGRLATDKQMSRFFVGVSADSLRKLRQHVSINCAKRAAG